MNAGKKAKKALSELVAFLLSLIILIPFHLLLINSFKSRAEASIISMTLPRKWEALKNYLYVIREGNLPNAYLHSIIVCVIAVVLLISFASVGAFILQRKKSKLAGGLYIFVLVGLTLPLSIVPTLFVLKTIGLSKTFLGAALIYAGLYFPYSVFLYVGYYKSIPVEIDEAALIDGCGPLRLFSIIFPLVKPITITILIVLVMSIWNDIGISIYILSAPAKQTVVLSTYFFYGQYQSNWNYLLADIVLISLPIVILYFVLQKYIISGLTSGAVKG